MAFTPQNFERLLGTPGMSDTLLKNHFTLYEGYVKNVNVLDASFEAMAKEGKTGTPEWNELRRRYGWEWNGMRLHELYFGNMTNGGKSMIAGGALEKAVMAQWGSIDAWMVDFKKTGAMRGIGWVMLVLDSTSGQLANIWINEHDVGHLAGTTPLLVMDVFEHAFMIDYGLKRADYIEAFFSSIDWSVAEARFGK